MPIFSKIQTETTKIDFSQEINFKIKKIFFNHNLLEIFTFKLTIGKTDGLQIQIEKLSKKPMFDPWEWIKKIETIIKNQELSNEDTVLLLKTITKKDLHGIFEPKRTKEKMLISLKYYFYPRSKFDFYYRKLKALKSWQFESCEEYLNRIRWYELRADICQSNKNSLTSRETFDAFIKGLTYEQKEIAFQLNIDNLEDLAKKIDARINFKRQYQYKRNRNYKSYNNDFNNKKYSFEKKKDRYENKFIDENKDGNMRSLELPVLSIKEMYQSE